MADSKGTKNQAKTEKDKELEKREIMTTIMMRRLGLRLSLYVRISCRYWGPNGKSSMSHLGGVLGAYVHGHSPEHIAICVDAFQGKCIRGVQSGHAGVDCRFLLLEL